jgi:surface antigen
MLKTTTLKNTALKNIALKNMLAMSMVALLATSCAQNGQGGFGANSGGGIGGTGISKSMVGGLAGAVGGAAVGSNIGKGRGNIAAIAIGTLLGAGLGSEIGASLDRADMSYYNRTSQMALETAQPGQALPWQNPQSGNSGTITPSNYYQANNGAYCREYNQTINVGGQVSQGYGKACRQPDGTWQIVQ